MSSVDSLKAAGVDEIMIYSVNDGAVIEAWSEDQGVPLEMNDGMLHLFADPYGQVTEALGMEMTHMGPLAKGLVGRSKRFALYIVNGVVKIVRVAEKDDDPAGDDFPDITLAEAMLVAIQSLQGSDEL
jgi:peroxiredoxin 5